jgi:hypothetical protein
MLTGCKLDDAKLEFFEDHIEVTRISTSRFECQARSVERMDRDERENTEANERQLLRELIECRVAQCKH